MQQTSSSGFVDAAILVEPPSIANGQRGAAARELLLVGLRLGLLKVRAQIAQRRHDHGQIGRDAVRRVRGRRRVEHTALPAYSGIRSRGHRATHVRRGPLRRPTAASAGGGVHQPIHAHALPAAAMRANALHPTVPHDRVRRARHRPILAVYARVREYRVAPLQRLRVVGIALPGLVLRGRLLLAGVVVVRVVVERRERRRSRQKCALLHVRARAVAHGLVRRRARVLLAVV